MALETWKLVVDDVDVTPWVQDPTCVMPTQDNANAFQVWQDFPVTSANPIITDSPIKDVKVIQVFIELKFSFTA